MQQLFALGSRASLTSLAPPAARGSLARATRTRATGSRALRCYSPEYQGPTPVQSVSRLLASPPQRRGIATNKGAAWGDREPEYHHSDLDGLSFFYQPAPFKLRSGEELPELVIAYETWGRLNADKNNAILLHTGMSASSHAHSHPGNPEPGWWEDFIGPGRPLDTNLFYVICSNNLGGCYGSTGPSSFHPDGKRYGSRFPRFEVYDQVAAQMALLDHLGIERVHGCVGASLGGCQSLCAGAEFSERVGKVVSISACAKTFCGSIAFRHTQRQAIMNDPHWNGGDYYDGELPAVGLQLARQLGTITYRSGEEWQERFGQGRIEDVKVRQMDPEFKIEAYLRHQGKKWVGNYDPNSLLWISKAADSFTMEKPGEDGKPNLVAGLKTLTMPALIIGMQFDVLFPVWQQKEIADTLRSAGNRSVVYYELDSIYGHDSFLLDLMSIGPAVKGHLEQEPGGARHLWEDMASSASRMLQVVASRNNTADSMRDLFRTLAEGSDTVDRDRLKSVVKLVWEKRMSEDVMTRLFQDLPPRVSLDEFLAVRTAMVKEASQEVFLP